MYQLLQSLQKENNLNQIDMAKILHMKHQQQYAELLKDISIGKMLSIKHGILLANHFSLSLDNIYQEYLEQPSKTENDFSNKFNRLSQSQQQSIQAVINDYLLLNK